MDSLECHVQLESRGGRLGLLGTAIVAGKATGIVDVSYYLDLARGTFAGIGAAERDGALALVLLVDGSRFEGQLLRAALESAGYSVTCAASGEDALALLETGREFDLILTDLRLPRMDGFELARRVRAHSSGTPIPVLALAEKSVGADREKAIQTGFAGYLIKSDHAAVIQGLSHATRAGQAPA